MADDARTFLGGEFLYTYAYEPLEFSFSTTLSGSNGVELQRSYGINNGSPSNPGHRIDLVGDDIIIIQNNSTSGSVKYFNEAFNGFTIEDNESFLRAILDINVVVSDLEFSSDERIDFDENSFSFDFRSLKFGSGERIRLDVDFSLTLVEAQTVALLFEAALNRDGQIGLGGLNFHIDAREAGLSEERLAQQFLDSPEFARAFGEPESLTDQELVEVLFRNVLNREGAAQEAWRN